MIAQLTGVILIKQPPVVIIDVNGVGYEVLAPMSTFYQLPDLNQSISLWIHLNVREDAITPYGFIQQRERDLFRALIKVSGVGPKLALSILSGIETDDFIRCIHNNDTSTLVSIPGIGKKTAERLIIETRDRLATWQSAPNANNPSSQGTSQAQEAISALINLGYKPNEAKNAINLVKGENLSSEEVIRQALKYRMKGAHA